MLPFHLEAHVPVPKNIDASAIPVFFVSTCNGQKPCPKFHGNSAHQVWQRFVLEIQFGRTKLRLNCAGVDQLPLGIKSSTF